LFSTELLLRFDRMPTSTRELQNISRALARRVRQLDGVQDVYSLANPLGGSVQTTRVTVVDRLLGMAAKRFYASEVLGILRFEVLIDHRPFSPEAMALIGRVKTAAGEQAADLTAAGCKTEAMLAGLTPYIIDVRAISGRDQVRVMVLATIVIGLIVLVVVRDPLLTVFMLLATWLTYGTTLTLSHWFFTEVLGEGGLDWKVRLIVFVIVVAVGQDYNLFLVSRLLGELKQSSEREATRRAIVSTGSVISSCGIIMAATLGSLWAGGLFLLRQVGFTLALGILIDTFFVRPLLIPAFFLATGRGRRAARSCGPVPRAKGS
jgi:RND superfamily putative drug exporter